MAYQDFNYTAVAPATDTPAQAFDHVDKNDIAVLDALIAGHGMLDWDHQIQEPSGTYPPVDPAHPARIIATRNSDTNYKLRATLTWSGDKNTAVVYEKTTNGGTLWEAMGVTARPLGKVTFTYSAVAGYETFVIASTWS